MRVSTAAFHNIAIEGLQAQQSALLYTQSQVASGKRIQSPADDPIGAVHVLELQRAQAETDQYARNSNILMTRLNTEEQGLSDTGDLLQRVRELVLQANSATTDSTGRSAIASELKQRQQELLDIANRRDGNGEFLFSGFATSKQPFSRVGNSVGYQGDQGIRVLQTSPTQKIADSHSGFETFMNVPQGNGTFVSSASASNTGSASITVGNVTSAATWNAAQPNTYTITFVGSDSYQITNSASAVIVPATPGNYTAGNAITVNGAQFSIEGIPAAGDVFTITPSQKEDMFTSLDKIVAAITVAGDDPASRGKLASALGQSIAQLDQATTHLQNKRAEVGARLSTLDNANAARDTYKVELQTTISNLQDVDYAEAISRMNRQMLGLQAAQQSYAQISNLSLFSYLR
jgi:flagellar hook-associated protein 3 FlgL